MKGILFRLAEVIVFTLAVLIDIILGAVAGCILAFVGPLIYILTGFGVQDWAMDKAEELSIFSKLYDVFEDYKRKVNSSTRSEDNP